MKKCLLHVSIQESFFLTKKNAKSKEQKTKAKTKKQKAKKCKTFFRQCRMNRVAFMHVNTILHPSRAISNAKRKSNLHSTKTKRAEPPTTNQQLGKNNGEKEEKKRGKKRKKKDKMGQGQSGLPGGLPGQGNKKDDKVKSNVRPLKRQ